MGISIIRGVDTYPIDDGSICRLVGHDGWGLPPINRFSSRAYAQHGDFDMGYRLQARIGSFVLQVPATDLGAMYTARASLLRVFNPDTVLQVRWDLPNGSSRQIDAYVNGDLAMLWEPKRWAALRAAVQLRCPDPTFYDPVSQVVNFTGLAGGSTWDIPWALSWNIGGGTVNSSQVINYAGDWATYPIIRITGPITDCKITNQSTGEVLDFTGTTIAGGAYYEIDTRPGYKTVLDNTGTNQISKLVTSSDLSTWHLAPDHESDGGVNSILVGGSSGTTATKVTFTYYNRYLGI